MLRGERFSPARASRRAHISRCIRTGRRRIACSCTLMNDRHLSSFLSVGLSRNKVICLLTSLSVCVDYPPMLFAPSSIDLFTIAPTQGHSLSPTLCPAVSDPDSRRVRTVRSASSPVFGWFLAILCLYAHAFIHSGPVYTTHPRCRDVSSTFLERKWNRSR